MRVQVRLDLLTVKLNYASWTAVSIVGAIHISHVDFAVTLKSRVSVTVFGAGMRIIQTVT